MKDRGYHVDIRGGRWTVTYSEAGGSLVLSFDLGVPRDILYAPAAARWDAEMPAWARGRRQEILERISAAFGGSGCVIVDV